MRLDLNIFKQVAVGGGRLRPRCCHQLDETRSDWCRYLANWTKHVRRLWLWTTPLIIISCVIIHKIQNT